MTVRWAVLLGAALVSGGLAAAASPPELRLPMDQEPSTLDPHKLFTDLDGSIALDLLEGLTTLAADGSAVAGAADRWEVSADGLAWTFHIRDDARWSDGAKVTADDFVYSLRRAVDPATATPFAAELLPIAGAAPIEDGRVADPATLGAEAVDAATLRLRLVEPTPWLLSLAAEPVMLPVSRRAIEAHGDGWVRAGTMPSNGAYLLADWIPHGEIRLVRNPDFHDAATVRAPVVRHILAEDLNAALKRWLAGDLDVARVPGDDVPAMQAAHAQALHREPWLATHYLLVNVTRPDLADRRIREALSLVIDRAILADKVHHDHPQPAYEFVPDGMPGYRPHPVGWAGLAAPERIARAQRLFAEARGSASGPLLLTVKSASTDRQRRDLLAVAQMWKTALGVETRFETRERRVFDDEVRRHDFDIVSTMWDADFVEPWNFLANFKADARDLNFGQYASDAYDGLLQRSRGAANDAGRMALLEQAEGVLMDDQPMIPLTHPVTWWLVDPHLHGWQGNPMSLHQDRYLWREE